MSYVASYDSKDVDLSIVENVCIENGLTFKRYDSNRIDVLESDAFELEDILESGSVKFNSKTDSTWNCFSM